MQKLKTCKRKIHICPESASVKPISGNPPEGFHRQMHVKRPCTASLQLYMRQVTFSALRKACSKPAASDRGGLSYLNKCRRWSRSQVGSRGSRFLLRVLPALAHQPATTAVERCADVGTARESKSRTRLRHSGHILAG